MKADAQLDVAQSFIRLFSTRQTADMGLGVLEDHKLPHVPGTVLLNDEAAHTDIAIGLKHGTVEMLISSSLHSPRKIPMILSTGLNGVRDERTHPSPRSHVECRYQWSSSRLIHRRHCHRTQRLHHRRRCSRRLQYSRCRMYRSFRLRILSKIRETTSLPFQHPDDDYRNRRRTSR